MGEGRFDKPVRLFSDVSSRVSDPWLRRAFHLAEQGRGTTSPNPLVGCVIVREDSPIGEGYHAYAGGPHAEVVALQHAGEAARGATAYVTLEPCTHHGRTPPCTEALLSAGIARVVVGMRDPNADVAGGGVEALRSSGVDVEIAEDATPFEIQNEAWIAAISRSRPFVRVKVALSLDGHAALEPGQRASITGASGSLLTARLRANADAVLVGGATVSIDDPILTVRDSGGQLSPRQPLRIVLVRDLVPSASARVFTDGLAPTLVLAPVETALAARKALPLSVEVVEYDVGGGLGAALASLASTGVVDVLIEPGHRLFTALWDEGLIDELITVQAGGLAGRGAPDLYPGPPLVDPADPKALSHLLAPLETGIEGDVVATVWRAPVPANDRLNGR